MNKADITVETRGERLVSAVTISLHVLLTSTIGLQPIVSAVNYKTQLRLEIQETRVVWMFYNLGSNQGFIIQTTDIVRTDRWIHIVADYDSESGVGRIFIDGRLSAKELSRVQFSPKWMLGLRFGIYHSGGVTYKMTGLLDELQFHDCVLTDEKITRLAKNCNATTCGEDQNDQEQEVAGELKCNLAFHFLPSSVWQEIVETRLCMYVSSSHT